MNNLMMHCFQAMCGLLSAFVLIFVSPAFAETKVFYFHNDQIGTPQLLTDMNQKVVWRIKYQPFGEDEVVEQDADGNGVAVKMPLRFPGQYYDQESGLHYNYFRDYDPSLGRYVQSDPIGLAGGMNVYGYALQNPINLIDPFGLTTANARILAAAARGNMSEVEMLLSEVSGLGQKELGKLARQCAQKRAKSLLEKLKKEGVGKGARSGQHGTPHKRAGAELGREANNLPNGPLKEAMKKEAERLILQGKSHSHK